MDTETYNAAEDLAPGIRVGDFVQAITFIIDEGRVVAEPGDVGTIIGKEYIPGFGFCFPTAKFERTGRIYDVTPNEVDVLAEPGFAATQDTTPRKPRRVAIKRGAV